jgi:hypothetical protein
MDNYTTCGLEPAKLAWKLAGVRSQKAFAQKAHSLLISEITGEKMLAHHAWPDLVAPWDKSREVYLGKHDEDRKVIAGNIVLLIGKILSGASYDEK